MRTNRWLTGVLLAMLAGWITHTLATSKAAAQGSVISRFAKMENFKWPLANHEGEFRGQPRVILKGREGTMQPSGHVYNLKGMVLETYRTDGSLEVVIESPECVYDNDTKIVSSAAQLKLRTVNGPNAAATDTNGIPGLVLEGRGFEWNQGLGRLAVSNEVHTILHREIFQARAGTTNTAAPQPLEIFSKSALINVTNRSAIYTDNVRVADPRSDILCELLTISGSTRGGNQIDTVVAERSVRIFNKQDGSRATGERALYNVTNNIVTLTGNPAIENAQGRMIGETVILDRERSELFTHGKVQMNLHGNTNLSGTMRPPMQVNADDSRISLTNRFAVYTGNVVADDPQMRLNSGTLTVTGMEKGGGAERIHATVGVNILNKADGSRASGDEGTFLAASNIVTLTGNAQLQNAQGKMAAREITLLRASNELFARHDVKTEIRYGTNNANPLLVNADEAQIQTTNRFAKYTGNVRVDDSKNLITADTLTVQGGASSNRLELIVAERNVTLTNRVDHSRAGADKVVYQADKDIVTLTGSPWLQNDDGKLTGEIIVLDRLQNTLGALGKVKTEVQLGTNRSLLPESKATGATPAPAPVTGRVPELLVITAGQMTASLTNRVAVYNTNVVVDSSQMILEGGRLTIISAQSGTNRGLERIIADTGRVSVVNKADGMRFTGTNATYTAATDSVELSGDPAYEQLGSKMISTFKTPLTWNRKTGKITFKKPDITITNPSDFNKKTNNPPKKN